MVVRPTSAAWKALVPHSHAITTTVDSWLGGVVLAYGVPVVSGQITYDDTGTVKRRLTMSVPARTPTHRWDPAGDPAAPLANYGQRLHVQTGVVYPNGAVERLNHGWYLITDWERDETTATVKVEAVSVAQLVADDRLAAPMAPLPGGTYGSEFRRVMGGILPVVIPPGFPDPPAAPSMVFDRDRDKALADLCSAWPARWYVDDTGAAVVAAPHGPVTVTTPLAFTITDGAAGTITGRARAAQRGALFNRMVVDGKIGDAGTVAPHAVADVTDPASPIRATGPYGVVTRFYASDLITTQAQAEAVADAHLVAYSTTGRVEKVTAVPDPAIQLGDVGRIFTRDGDAYTGRVTAITLPLTVRDGPMGLSVSVAPGTPIGA